jgi:hypothetical protein
MKHSTVKNCSNTIIKAKCASLWRSGQRISLVMKRSPVKPRAQALLPLLLLLLCCGGTESLKPGELFIYPSSTYNVMSSFYPHHGRGFELVAVEKRRLFLFPSLANSKPLVKLLMSKSEGLTLEHMLCLEATTK